MPKKNTANHYLDNEKFTKEVTIYAKNARDAIESGKTPEPMNDYIGESLLNMARKMSSRANFSGYSFKDEMQCDALEDVIKYLKNFDPEKGLKSAQEKAVAEGKDPSTVKFKPSAFSYVSRIMWYAFLRRMGKEKKHFEMKQKLIDNAGIIDAISELQEHDDNQYINQYLDNFKSLSDDYHKLSVKNNKDNDDVRTPSDVRILDTETLQEIERLPIEKS